MEAWKKNKGVTVADHGVTKAIEGYYKSHDKFLDKRSPNNLREVVGALKTLQAAVATCSKNCKPKVHDASKKLLLDIAKYTNSADGHFADMQRDYVVVVKQVQAGVAKSSKALADYLAAPSQNTAAAAGAELAALAKLIQGFTDSVGFYSGGEIKHVWTAMQKAAAALKKAGASPSPEQVRDVQDAGKALKAFGPPQSVAVSKQLASLK